MFANGYQSTLATYNIAKAKSYSEKGIFDVKYVINNNSYKNTKIDKALQTAYEKARIAAKAAASAGTTLDTISKAKIEADKVRDKARDAVSIAYRASPQGATSQNNSILKAVSADYDVADKKAATTAAANKRALDNYTTAANNYSTAATNFTTAAYTFINKVYNES